MSSTSCDVNCPGTKVCYNNTSWIKTHNDSQSGCYCDSYFGYYGPNCDLVGGPAADFLVAINSFEAALGLLGWILSVILLVYVVKAMTWEKLKSDHQFYTLVWVHLTFFFVVSYTSLEIAKVFCPWLYGTVDANGYRISELHYPTQLSLGFALFFITIAAINVSLAWIDVIYRMRHFSKDVYSFVLVYRKCSIVLEVIWLITVTVLMCVERPEIVVWIGLILWLYILIIYAFGRHRIIGLMRPSSSIESRDSVYAHVIYTIHVACILVMLFGTLGLVGGLGIAIVQYSVGYREIVTPYSTVTIVHVFTSIIPLAIDGAGFSLLWYLFQNKHRSNDEKTPEEQNVTEASNRAPTSESQSEFPTSSSLQT